MQYRKFSSVLPTKKDEVVYDPDSVQDDILFTDLEDIEDFPNDTQTALQIIRQQNKQRPCVILKTHLYYLVKDKTALERELMEQQYEGIIREYQLPDSSDSYYVFVEDVIEALSIAKEQYLTKIEQNLENPPEDQPIAKSSMHCGTLTGPPAIGYGLRALPFNKSLSEREKELLKEKEKKTVVFDDFAANFVPNYIGLTVSSEAMLKLMYPHTWLDKSYDDIRPLIHARAITVSIGAKNGVQGFQLACPGAEIVLAQIKRGRTEIIRTIKRTRYKEEYLAVLENKKLKNSSFPSSFHLKDLLGGDYVEQFETPTGTVIALPSHR
eukprot:CAMPEP_0206182808 /NCGR_PEP_ID=MMETSP0166-20121206/274_1 /ASSEMBLY_ACC=CAM_ASM_000260 /TAXON_ID=95228 /ORGANISM="Vannella robusta, Strain DIVA3 518/3/11/1/6" /LENGTH=323 /DNA_ID=CAMNT_0053597565 /DNA_START=390 /DNA_END=1361 /DNA_ORIENTATION=-